MKRPDAADATVADWLTAFVGFHEELVFATEPTKEWQAIIAAVKLQATKGVRTEYLGWSYESEEPRWQRTYEPEPDPLEGLDPDLAADLLAAFISAMSTLTTAAQQLHEATLRRQTYIHSESAGAIDPDAPF